MSEQIEKARAAFERHEWREALDLLTETDQSQELEPPDLERLAEAAWWMGRLGDTIGARERAYAAHRRLGDARGAARMAIKLASDYGFKGEGSLSAGWFRRAERLLGEVPESPEHGYLSRRRAALAVDRGDIKAAFEHADRTIEIGERLQDPDLQALGLTHRGQALILDGRVEEGLALVEEAVVAAVGGELSPWPTGAIYCNAINICRELADFGRAGEWTEAAKRWCERQSISGFPGICRVQRAEIVRLRGAWQEAELEARRATEELGEFWLEVAGEGFYDIGEIRRRMGDLEAAEDAFRQANELGRVPQPGLALLRLAQGNADAAMAGVRGGLANESLSRLGRAQLLPALVEIAVAAGDLEAAREGAAELDSIAETYATAGMLAEAAVARGRVQLAERDAGPALVSLRRGWQQWKEISAPYEAARARMLLGEASRAAGSDEDGRLHIEAALSTFERLGGTTDARRADELLGSERPRTGAVEMAERTFMFTDIVKSTNLIEAVGDVAWESLVSWHDRTLRSLFGTYGGQEIDHAGDGFFVAFEAAGPAIECAAGIQRALSEHRRAHGFAPQVRIGLHTAAATKRGHAYRGKGVHLAARIAGVAEGEEIVAGLSTAESSRFPTSEPRSVELKGIPEPTEVVTIDWRQPAPSRSP